MSQLPLVIGQAKRFQQGSLDVRSFLGAAVVKAAKLREEYALGFFSPAALAFWTTSDFNSAARGFAKESGMGVSADSKIRSLLAPNLKRARKNMNLSQLALATETEMAANFINSIEHGKKWVSPESMQNLCDPLSIQPYQLFLPEKAEVAQKDVAIAACCNELARETIHLIKRVRARHLRIGLPKSARPPRRAVSIFRFAVAIEQAGGDERNGKGES